MKALIGSTNFQTRMSFHQVQDYISKRLYCFFKEPNCKLKFYDFKDNQKRMKEKTVILISPTASKVHGYLCREFNLKSTFDKQLFTHFFRDKHFDRIELKEKNSSKITRVVELVSGGEIFLNSNSKKKPRLCGENDIIVLESSPTNPFSTTILSCDQIRTFKMDDPLLVSFLNSRSFKKLTVSSRSFWNVKSFSKVN